MIMNPKPPSGTWARDTDVNLRSNTVAATSPGPIITGIGDSGEKAFIRAVK